MSDYDTLSSWRSTTGATSWVALATQHTERFPVGNRPPPSKVKWGFHSRVAAVTRSYRTWQMLLVCPCRPVRSAMERFSETFMISNQLATRWCQGWHDLVGLTASLILAMGSTDRDALCWDVMMHSYKKYHGLGFWCLVQICWSSEFMSESLLGLSPSTACLVPLTDDISPVATL